MAKTKINWPLVLVGGVGILLAKRHFDKSTTFFNKPAVTAWTTIILPGDSLELPQGSSFVLRLEEPLNIVDWGCVLGGGDGEACLRVEATGHVKMIARNIDKDNGLIDSVFVVGDFSTEYKSTITFPALAVEPVTILATKETA